MSVLIWVSNGDIQCSNRICSQDQHAQAQHWLRQAQLVLSLPEPMLSMSMLILATYPVAAFDVAIRNPNKD